jgi:uncharacterized protein YjbI with pentapeptide repeats
MDYGKRVFETCQQNVLVWCCLGLLTLIFWLGLGVSSASWALNYTKQNLIEADFSGRDLRDGLFDHANLRSANFSHANLQGVRFFAANLEGANFEGADLRGADLESARLTDANFTNANLEGAFATNTLVGGVKITGADFTDVLLSLKTEKILCDLAEGTNPTTGRNTHDTLYCP